MEIIKPFSGPSNKAPLTVLLFAHADQIFQNPDSLLHRLQLGRSPRPAALRRLQLLHHERSQSVDVRRGQGSAGVLEHRQQQLVASRLNLWGKRGEHVRSNLILFNVILLLDTRLILLYNLLNVTLQNVLSKNICLHSSQNVQFTVKNVCTLNMKHFHWFQKYLLVTRKKKH